MEEIPAPVIQNLSSSVRFSISTRSRNCVILVPLWSSIALRTQTESQVNLGYEKEVEPDSSHGSEAANVWMWPLDDLYLLPWKNFTRQQGQSSASLLAEDTQLGVPACTGGRVAA